MYAVYPSSHLAQASCPTAPQASGSQVNSADLSAAHGAAEMHSQTLAKHPVLPKVASNGIGSNQSLGQALRPPLAGLASAQPGAVLQEALHTQAWDSILLLWHSLCEFITPLSRVVQELATSVNRRALTLKLLQVNSDTTVSRYVSSCLSFFSFVADLGLDLSAVTQVQAVEAIMVLHLSKHQDQDDPIDASSAALVHPVNTLKALRWLIKVSLLQFPDTYGGLFRALSSGPTSDRKEALALPLDFVAFLEALVLDPGSEPATVSFAGAALLSVWASLRFGDASHVKWSSLLYDISCHVVRGVAYRTKTTRRGMPFACQGRGIYGYWAATWLRSLDRLWLYLEDSGLCIDPDSLFFACVSYQRLLLCLRWMTCVSAFL